MASCYYVFAVLISIYLCTVAAQRGRHQDYSQNNQCQNIATPMCKHYLPYGKTLLPNIFGHRDQVDINFELYQLYPVIESRCNSRLGEFLCRAYFPECSHDSGEIVQPCRPLCLMVKEQCGEVLERYGFQWPESLNCHRLPAQCSRFTEIERTEYAGSCTNIGSDGVGYNRMDTCASSLPSTFVRLPNPFWHQSLSDVKEALQMYEPMFKTECSTHLKDFLCSFYLPECRRDNRLVLPCRSLCLLAMSGCRHVAGFTWPRSLDCQKLPDSGNCYAGSNTSDPRNNRNVWAPETITNGTTGEIVASRICRDSMPYRYTRFPNTRGHTNQIEAHMELHEFYSGLIKSNCSPHLKAFLCSVYIPPAMGTTGKLFPCRNLCESAKSGCKVLMNKFYVRGKFRCKRYPSSGMCFDGQSVIDQDNDAEGLVDQIPKPPLDEICEMVTDPICKDTLPYETTRLPNVLWHRTSSHIHQELLSYSPIIQTNCSVHLKDFLCSLHFPKCQNNEGLVLPCRSLCLRAMSGCRSQAENLGFIWPLSLDCQKLPASGNCYTGFETTATPSTSDIPEEETVSPASPATSSMPMLDDNLDKPTTCTLGDFNCRHATSLVFLDGQTVCCFDERLLFYKSGCQSGGRSAASTCKCIYPTPQDVPGSC